MTLFKQKQLCLIIWPIFSNVYHTAVRQPSRQPLLREFVCDYLHVAPGPDAVHKFYALLKVITLIS